MKHITVISPVKLTAAEIATLQVQLHVENDDEFVVKLDPSLIAGLKVIVDGKALDLSVKRQLADI
jgi:F0F1-type ATP synthase delta subunit